MSAPLPSALRTRFQRCIEEGLSGRAGALRLWGSPGAQHGARWARQVRTKARRNLHRKGLRVAMESWLRIGRSLRNGSPRTLTSRALNCGTPWRRQKMFRRITQPSPTGWLGLGSRTKKSLLASERRRAKVRDQRTEWFTHRLPAIGRHPDRVVFIASRDIAAQSPASWGMKPL